MKASGQTALHGLAQRRTLPSFVHHGGKVIVSQPSAPRYRRETGRKDPVSIFRSRNQDTVSGRHDWAGKIRELGLLLLPCATIVPCEIRVMA